MSDRKRCPTCRTTLEAHETILPEGNAIGVPGGSTIIYYRCPVAKPPFDSHPSLPCPNCGDDVPAQQFHWYSREGLLGSGRWTCTSTHERERTREFIDDTVKRLNDKEPDATEA